MNHKKSVLTFNLIHILTLFVIIIIWSALFAIYSKEGIQIVSCPSSLTSLHPCFYANTKELKSANVTVGTSIYTKGFYSENDGGAAEYKISSSPLSMDIPNISIPLNNGLYANLVFSDSINVKQIGARGNGSGDDSGYFQSIINSGKNVTIPGGSYNLNFNDLHCPSSITLKGENKKTTIIKNSTIYAPNGITASNITFDGGNRQSVAMIGRQTFAGTFLVIVTPEGKTAVKYNNCVFQNADYGSFAMESKDNSPNSFSSDKVSGCTFSNIKRIGVYHCVDSLVTLYTGNIFTNIGDSNVTSGTIAALKIGDTTNNTTIGSKDCTISNNTFKNLYSGDDYSYGKHSIACNFITILGEKAKINSNKFYNLYGYGDDRETIYTKVRKCTISNNYILNGGFGEGYICCKGYPTDDFYSNISGNTLEGDFGAGIKCYGDASICKNNINISHCMRGISCNGSDVVTKRSLTIDSNHITTNVCYFYNGSQKVDSYTPTYMIQAESYGTPVTISNNTITADSSNNTTMQALVRVGSVKTDFTVSGNILKSSINNCRGIEISAKEEFQNYNKNSKFKIISNKLTTAFQPVAITIQGNMSGTNRLFEIRDNELSCTIPLEYCITVSDSNNNSDTIIYKNANKNITYSIDELYTNVNTIQQ